MSRLARISCALTCWRSRLSGVAVVLVATAAAGCGQQSDELATLRARLAKSEARLQVLEDVNAIEKLNRAYGYYVDKGLWDQVVDLFAENSSVEIEAGGVYLGRQGADRLFRQKFGNGRIGFPDGVLFNHPQFQGIVDVDPGAQTAKGRWRTLAQVAWYGRRAFWNEGVYENEYVKEAGVWKFSKMRFWSTFFTPYDRGWARQAIPPIGWGANMPSDAPAPDRPSDPSYRMYPRYFVPPFHYANPVSGRPFEAPKRSAADEFPADTVSPQQFAAEQFGSGRQPRAAAPAAAP